MSKMSELDLQLKVVGLKQAIKALNDIDKKARRQLTKDYKQIVDPVIQEAKRRVPKEAPISGWERNWKTRSGRQLLPWVGTTAERFIKAKVSGKKPREYNGNMTNLAVFSVAFAGGINQAYDLAGRTSRGATKAGANMIRGLEARHGKASRVLWPAYDMHREDVIKQIDVLITEVMRQTSKEI
jgi:hypothetical protein